MTATQHWWSSGAMHLTGRADGPPLAVDHAVVEQVEYQLGRFGLDARVLAERAAAMALQRGGRWSCGLGSRLLEATDGWVAVTLARPSDVEALPAVFEVDPALVPDRGSTSAVVPWAAVEHLVRGRGVDELVERARLLGLPISGLGAGPGTARVRGRCRIGATASARPTPRVLDLTALWAGPLAAGMLLHVGAEVVKVEDRRRPDGARRGDRGFFDLLNAGKCSVALDLGTDAGTSMLRLLVDSSDIVISSSRARALDGLGLDPERFLAAGTDRVWVAITAHGWDDERVGFGDDAAVAAGMVAYDPVDGTPLFVADAIADPMCGAYAAHEGWKAWEAGGRWFIDASLSGVARAATRSGAATAATRCGAPDPGTDPVWCLGVDPVGAPVTRRPSGAAPRLGADTDAILAAL